MAEFTERWHVRFRGAQRDLIDACGGVERVAELSSFSKSVVGRWRGPTDRDEMPYRVALMLEDDCGRPILTRLMAQFNGRKLSNAEAGDGAAINTLSAQVADLVEHAGKLVVETVRAKADGIVTPSEADQLRALNATVARLTDEIAGALASVKAEGGLKVVEGGAA